jgi:formylglycine-generating enzyme required for sulfatase activity
MLHRTMLGLPHLGSVAFYLLFLAQSWAQSPPTLGVQVQGGVATLTLLGDIGSPCTLQFATNLNGAWFTLSNYTLLSSPALVVDAAAATNGRRFYRAAIFAPTNAAWLASGTFVMGSPTNETERAATETQHTVTLTRGYYVGKWLVRQTDYLSLMNTNPSYYTPSNGVAQDLSRPVEQVSWFEATNYCAHLTTQERAAGRIFATWVYRLPTEAEWEYACRAGTTTPFYYGNNLSSGMANFDGGHEYVGGTGTVLNPTGTFLNRTVAVGSYAPNAVGLYDMAGNAWEWCLDWYGSYPTGSVIDPHGPATGSARVFRGGTLNSIGSLCRSANRNSYNPAFAFNTIGFRVVLASQ